MKVSSVRKLPSRGTFLSALAGLILIAAPMCAAAAEPYDTPYYGPSAYQVMPAQYYGEPPPRPYYPAPPGLVARRNQLRAQLYYAEAQYRRARESRNRPAAEHWAKEIKHLKRELSSLDRRAGRYAYGMPAQMAPSPAPVYPLSAYAAPMPEYAPPASAYAPPPPMPKYGYAGTPPAPYPSAAYPSAASPNGTTAPYGAAPTGSMGDMVHSLLGPVLGSGPVPSAANPSPYGAAATGSTGSMVNSLLGSMFGSGQVR